MLTGEGIDVIVHATHEANYKIGGIGAVLDGLLSARGYLRNVRRSILVGTFDHHDEVGMERLQAPRNGLEVVYSSLLGRSDEDGLAQSLRDIERRYRVRIIYGRRSFAGARHEIILVDPNEADLGMVNSLKFRLWERFGLQSDRYEGSWEYEHYLRAAQPQYEALEAVLGADRGRRRSIMMAHEFMGVPLCLVAELTRPGAFCRVYYAHEVPSVRPVVEGSPGHDTMFYNVLQLARRHFLSFPELFGDQSAFFKAALLDATSDFAAVLAVGDWVVEELRFLGARYATKAIDLVYNGIPTSSVTLAEKLQSLQRLRDYADNLIGWRPDYVFTHVTRLVTSKGLWRDLRVLEQLDPRLQASGKRAVFYILATTLPAGRLPSDILRMEAEYGWPTEHREGHPDLVGSEVPLYRDVEKFNRRGRCHPHRLRQSVRLGPGALRPPHARRHVLPGHPCRHRSRVRPEHLRAIRHRPGRAPSLRRPLRRLQRLWLRRLRPPRQHRPRLTRDRGRLHHACPATWRRPPGGRRCRSARRHAAW